MQVIVQSFVGWLHHRDAHNPQVEIVDGLLTISAGLLIALGVCMGLQL